jgi:hypothetical protein
MLEVVDLYTLHGVGLKNEYCIFVASVFAKKHKKTAFMRDKQHIIMKYKNQIHANKSNYWHRSNKNRVVP